MLLKRLEIQSSGEYFPLSVDDHSQVFFCAASFFTSTFVEVKRLLNCSVLQCHWKKLFNKHWPPPHLLPEEELLSSLPALWVSIPSRESAFLIWYRPSEVPHQRYIWYLLPSHPHIHSTITKHQVLRPGKWGAIVTPQTWAQPGVTETLLKHFRTRRQSDSPWWRGWTFCLEPFCPLVPFQLIFQPINLIVWLCKVRVYSPKPATTGNCCRTQPRQAQ